MSPQNRSFHPATILAELRLRRALPIPFIIVEMENGQRAKWITAIVGRLLVKKIFTTVDVTNQLLRYPSTIVQAFDETSTSFITISSMSPTESLNGRLTTEAVAVFPLQSSRNVEQNSSFGRCITFFLFCTCHDQWRHYRTSTAPDIRRSPTCVTLTGKPAILSIVTQGKKRKGPSLHRWVMIQKRYVKQTNKRAKLLHFSPYCSSNWRTLFLTTPDSPDWFRVLHRIKDNWCRISR